MIKLDKADSLAKASKNLMLSSPYYGLFLMMLNKSWNNQVPTAGVSKNGINYQLVINEKFWNSLTQDWQQGVLHHECMHLVFFHVERWSEFEDKSLANISADLVCNQYIEPKYLPGFEGTKEQFDAKWDPIAKKAAEDFESGKLTKAQYEDEIGKIPPRGVYIKDFAELKLELKQGTRYYYDKLQQAKDQKEKTGSSGCKNLDNLLDQMSKGEGDPCNHGSWSDFDGMSEAEKKLLHSQTDYQLKEVAESVIKSRGTIPGELKDYIDNIDKKEPPKFDWKGYLRNFIGGSTKTYTRKTRRKDSKRFEGSPGQRVLTQKHVLLGLDTSGSVSNDELKEFLDEFYHITKTGTEVTVVQFDSAISHIEKFNPRKEGYNIKGRGGTDFTPFCDYYNENYRKFCCGILFTDGEAPPPENLPRGRMLWVHSSKSNINESLPGYKIKLN